MGGWRLGLVWFAALVGVVFAGGPVQAQGARPDPESVVPLPATLEITAPGADVPAALAAFQGAWVGTWEDEFRNILVVERIFPDGRANVVYAWADSAFFGVSRGWLRTEAKIDKGVLSVQRFGWTDALTADGTGRSPAHRPSARAGSAPACSRGSRQAPSPAGAPSSRRSGRASACAFRI